MRPGSKPSMTPETVRRIRALHSQARQSGKRCFLKPIAREAGASLDAVRSVVRRRSYTWVE